MGTIERMGRIVGVALLVAGAAVAAEEPDLIPGMGDQWPDLRGPLGNFEAVPCETPLIDDLKNKRRVWVSEREFPGPAHQCHQPNENMMGSPIVAEDMVFTVFYQPDGDALSSNRVAALELKAKDKPIDRSNPPDMVRLHAIDHVVALDLATGKTLWDTALPRQGYNWINLNEGMRNQLVYGDGRVYLLGSTCAMYAVDAKTGAVLWETDMGEDVNELFAQVIKAEQEGTRGPPMKYATTHLPAFVDGVIAQGFTSRVKSGFWALDAATGEHLWQDPGLAHGMASELMAFAPDGAPPVFIGVRSVKNLQSIVALEPRTGKELWAVPVEGVQWLARKGNRIVGSGGRALVAVEVNDGKGNLLWQREWPGGNKYERAMIVGGTVIMAEQAKSFNVYELATGKELFSDSGGTRILGDYVKPIAANGRLYAFGGVRDLNPEDAYRYRANRVGVMAADFDPSPVRYMWPVIVDGRMVAHCSSRIACWDLRVDENQ